MSADGESFEEKVLRWVTENALVNEKLQDEAANFRYRVEYPRDSGTYTDIINPKDHPDLLLLIATISIDPIHQTALQSLPQNKRMDFLDDLTKTLLFQPVSYYAVPEMYRPESIQFSKELYLDGINKMNFIEGMAGIYRCITYVVWKYRSKFDASYNHDDPGSMYR
jgi:hypothetical protein